MTRLWRPSRRLFIAGGAALIASPAIVRAQSPLRAFPPGTFQNRSALDAAGGGPAGSGWGDHGTLLSLSTTTISNDTVTTSSGSFSTVRGTQIRGAGFWYFELKAKTAGSGFYIPGLMDAATANGAAMDGFLLFNSLQHYSANGTAKAIGADLTGVDIGSGWTSADNDVTGVFYDGTNGFQYLAFKNVPFLGGDPTSGALGTGHVGAYSTPPVSLYPAMSMAVDGVYQLITSNFTYPPPAPYLAWA